MATHTHTSDGAAWAAPFAPPTTPRQAAPGNGLECYNGEHGWSDLLRIDIYSDGEFTDAYGIRGDIVRIIRHAVAFIDACDYVDTTAARFIADCRRADVLVNDYRTVTS